MSDCALRLREFRVPATACLSELKTRLGQDLDIEFDAGRNLTRQLLDSFDWRCWATNLCVEFESARTVGRLRLTRMREGLSTSFEQSRLPTQMAEISSVSARLQLSAVLDVRSLLPRLTVRTHRESWLIRDANDKTVLRGWLEVSRIGRGRPLTTRLSAQPLRGFDKQARRWLRYVRRELHFPEVDETVFAEAIRLAEIDTTAPSFCSAPGTPTQARTDQATKQSLQELERMLDFNLPGVLDDVDTECLHEVRVAVRRTRSVLRHAKSIFPSAKVAGFRREFGWLGQETGRLRDLDVYLLNFDEQQSSLSAKHRAPLEPLRNYLQAARNQEHERVCQVLRSVRFRRLKARWHAFLEAPVPNRTVLQHARQAIAVSAQGHIWTAYRRVIRLGRHIEATSEAALLHDLRKRAKTLRYLIEFYRPVLEDRDTAGLVSSLKRLQDNLGEIQDLDVEAMYLADTASDLAVTNADASTDRAIGVLVGKLLKRLRKARTRFDGQFSNFDSRKVRNRVRRLCARHSRGTEA